MTRRSFAEILKGAGFDARREYINLYNFFFDDGVSSIWSIINDHFSPDMFNDTSISLRDFDERYGFVFSDEPGEDALDGLMSLCEYEFNLMERSIRFPWAQSYGLFDIFVDECELISRIIENAGYEAVDSDGFTVFVERNAAADLVAQILPDPISWKQLAYGHRSLRGNLEGKKRILLELADWLEPRRSCLKQNNQGLESLVFCCLNNLNIRHNNLDAGRYFNPAFSSLDLREREELYDEVYQLLLIAVLEVDFSDRKEHLVSIANKTMGERAGR